MTDWMSLRPFPASRGDSTMMGRDRGTRRVDDADAHACCAPRFEHPQRDTVPVSGRAREGHRIEQALLSGGALSMGDSHGDGRLADGEGPVHTVTVDPFMIDVTSVTNAQFAAFVDDTGYQTESEEYGFSAVFYLAFAGDDGDVLGRVPQAPWWLSVRGAHWRCPRGSFSSVAGIDDHPVVHVSWNDAQAYCQWAGRRLPTEAEWEYASRGGLDGARFPWGDELLDDFREWQCNIWQGAFPTVNTEADGWLTTSPVRSFRPNGYGLWQTVGNVWEWCSDWFDTDYFSRSPRENPCGPERGDARVMKGGSFLCHDSYCNRYRNSARSSNTPDSSTANTGFRTVASP